MPCAYQEENQNNQVIRWHLSMDRKISYIFTQIPGLTANIQKDEIIKYFHTLNRNFIYQIKEYDSLLVRSQDYLCKEFAHLVSRKMQLTGDSIQ